MDIVPDKGERATANLQPSVRFFRHRMAHGHKRAEMCCCALEPQIVRRRCLWAADNCAEQCWTLHPATFVSYPGYARISKHYTHINIVLSIRQKTRSSHEPKSKRTLSQFRGTVVKCGEDRAHFRLKVVSKHVVNAHSLRRYG